MNNKTYMLRTEDVNKKWYLIDAKGKTLGRLSTKVASILRGKNKCTFTPHIDCGDKVIIINAASIKLTGNKLMKKKYYKHSGYIGGLKVKTAQEMLTNHPEEMLKKSITGMLPHTRLGRKQSKDLFIYKDENHLHEAQQPLRIELD